MIRVTNNTILMLQNEIRKSRGAIFNEDVEKSVPLTAISSNIAMVSPGSGFLNLLRYGMLALRLLPVSNFSSILIYFSFTLIYD